MSKLYRCDRMGSNHRRFVLTGGEVDCNEVIEIALNRAAETGARAKVTCGASDVVDILFNGAMSPAIMDQFTDDVVSDIEAKGYTRDPLVPGEVNMRGSTGSDFGCRRLKVLGKVPKKLAKSKTRSILDLTEVV